MALLILIWVGVTLIPLIILGIMIWMSINEGEAGHVRLVIMGVCALLTVGLIIGTVVNANDFKKRRYVTSINQYLDTLRTDDGPVINGSTVNYMVKKSDRKLTLTLVGISEEKYSGEENFTLTLTEYSEGNSRYIKYTSIIRNNEVGTKNIRDVINTAEVQHSTYYSDSDAISVASSDINEMFSSLVDELIIIGKKSYYTTGDYQFWDNKLDVRKLNLFQNYKSKALD